VVSFTLWSLYSQGKIIWYPLNRRLGEPKSLSRERERERERRFSVPAGNQIPILQPVTNHFNYFVIPVHINNLVVLKGFYIQYLEINKYGDFSCTMQLVT
jgi:hypothetical protein